VSLYDDNVDNGATRRLRRAPDSCGRSGCPGGLAFESTCWIRGRVRCGVECRGLAGAGRPNNVKDALPLPRDLLLQAVWVWELAEELILRLVRIVRRRWGRRVDPAGVRSR
jgi:hypothetical protein